MNGNHLAIPGRFDLGVICHPGPMAQQVQINVPKANGMDIHAFGGLSKIEHGVFLLAAGDRDAPAAELVARANDLIAACAAENAKDNHEHGQNETGSAPPTAPSRAPAASPAEIIIGS